MYASHFSIANIPFGIASSACHPQKSAATRLGDDVIFLDILAENGLLSSLPETTIATFSQASNLIQSYISRGQSAQTPKPTLNAFAALPKPAHAHTRQALQTLLLSSHPSPTTTTTASSLLPANSTAPHTAATMHLPLSIGDFTDFSCSRDHVLNAGEAIMKKRSLPPGFLHFPIGYAGRASSVVVSGTSVTRPWGQFRGAGKGGGGGGVDRKGEEGVVFAPTRELDYELEVACIVGKPSQMGKAVSIADADEHIFGLVLLNDWSARDIQALEMPPLGPLNGKSFATSISPWVVTLDALASYEAPAPPRETLRGTISTASYLRDSKPWPTYAVHLQAELLIDDAVTTICKSELSSMYWSFRDLVAHQTSNGCCLNTGDLLGTGTISGSDDDAHGCLLELTRGGEVSFPVNDGTRISKRMYLKDGDAVRISGWAGEGVGFGDCLGVVLPAN